MAEHIDKAAAIKLLTSYGLEVSDSKRRAVAKCISKIEFMPAADVEPVKHGRWNIQDGTKTRRVCSVCGFNGPEYVKFYGYCPNCGAKMDLEVENDG